MIKSNIKKIILVLFSIFLFLKERSFLKDFLIYEKSIPLKEIKITGPILKKGIYRVPMDANIKEIIKIAGGLKPSYFLKKNTGNLVLINESTINMIKYTY